MMSTATTTIPTPPRPQQTIATLLAYRDALAMDLATMGSAKQGTRWHLDRQRELDGTNRRLIMMGVTG